MKRITNALLQTRVDLINSTLGTPQKPWIDGKPQAYCIHLEYANGRVGLLQHSDAGSGCSHVLHGTTKRELFDQMDGILAGIRLTQKHSKGENK
ncbi:MAG: hypothetical protein GY753_06950 [Gammaproteobacteria bacterium]|nr:hypothetical protein [Gammaproteobacteria bacterium]